VSGELAKSLGISELTASVLVRRGLTAADDARAFLDAVDPRHDPFLLGAMRAACERIRPAGAGGRTIRAQGGFDVGGVGRSTRALVPVGELGVDAKAPP